MGSVGKAIGVAVGRAIETMSSRGFRMQKCFCDCCMLHNYTRWKISTYFFKVKENIRTSA